MIEYSALENPILHYMQSLTLLCVEDSKSIRTAYKIYLKGRFGKILFAENGEEGLEVFSKEKVDIIIADNYMPKLDGIEMIQEIRKKDKKIPIILVTALEETNLIIKALQLNVTDFLRKPIDKEQLLQTLEEIAKGIYAEAIIHEEEERKLQHLQEKHEYSTYQEKLAFLKELNILRNDLYYKLLYAKKRKQLVLVDIVYKPLDTLSGDAYSIRKIDDTKYLYFIVDGMGKGISASQSAILLTSHINYCLDKCEKKEFDFEELLEDIFKFIQPILLDEETISLDIFVFDYEVDKLNYVKFAMPASLAQTFSGEIKRIKSNNPPLSKYSSTFKISSIDITDLEKFLFFSDGLVENSTVYPGKTYADFIEDDFFISFSKEELKSHFFSKIKDQEDDIALIFINKIKVEKKLYATRTFSTCLEQVEEANNWYSNICEQLIKHKKLQTDMEVTFTELFMNAYEHGNLGLGEYQKHSLIEKDEYFDELVKREGECSKEIRVSVFKIEYLSSVYVLTMIIDEGEGFDTHRLSAVLKELQQYNGRGIFMSKRSSLGIYYNEKGNGVFYLFKVS